MKADPQNHPASGSRPQGPPKLRQARFEDYTQIAALAARFELHVEDYSGWAHLWADNPAHREIKDTFPMGWVLENDEGAIVGYLGNVPMNYEFEGKSLLAATTRAWVVDTPYRAYSPLLLGTYFQQPNVDLFLSTTVNKQSADAYKIFEGIPVPQGAWDRARFWITDYPGFMESFLRQKWGAMWGLGAIRKPLSYPAAAGIFLRDLIARSPLSAKRCAAEVVSGRTFDDRFESFWADLRKKKSNVLLAVRNREALQWHFKFALQQNRAWIYTVESNSRLVAYSVFLHYDYEPIGLRRMRLVDFQCLDQKLESELLITMLRAAMTRCRLQSIHMLELIGLPLELEKALECASPLRRDLSSWLYFYKAGNPVLAQRLSKPAAWEPSLFDGDSSL